VEIDLLAHHKAFIPQIASLYEEEWPHYYGVQSKVNPVKELEAGCNLDRLPICLVAFEGETVLGAVSLKASSILSEVSQFPWIGALLVTPKMRRKGTGTLLLRSVMKQAKELGFYTLYAATESAGNLFSKEGWVYDDLLLMEGKEIIIYRYCV